jgi:hypothetical protein
MFVPRAGPITDREAFDARLAGLRCWRSSATRSPCGDCVILVDWQQEGFVPLTEHGTLYLGRAFGEAVWTAFDLWPLRVGDGVGARYERQNAWASEPSA